jgi:hypothetical protein
MSALGQEQTYCAVRFTLENGRSRSPVTKIAQSERIGRRGCSRLPLGAARLSLCPSLCERQSKLPLPAFRLPWREQSANVGNRLINLIEHPASLFEHDRQVDDNGHRSLS